MTGRDGWAGSTAVIVASGPSLTVADCEIVGERQRERGWKCIAVKENYRLLAGADAIYACDGHWWRNPPLIEQLRAHGAELWTQDVEAAQQFGLNWIRGEGSSGLGRKHIHWGGNSGFQAINLAFLWGASRIVLLGFDMQPDAATGASHWFGEHKPAPGVPVRNPKKFDSWIRHLQTMARDLSDAGITVYNATRSTALSCFARMPIDQIPG